MNLRFLLENSIYVEVNNVSDLGELILKISERKDLENDLKSNEEDIKNIICKIDLKEIKEDRHCDYHTLKPIMDDIQLMIPEDLKGEINSLLHCKKIEAYPELLKATYFPEINQLNIPDSEKVRIDEAARVNCRYHMAVNNLSRLKYKLSVEDLEMLVLVGVAEKRYVVQCKHCGDQVRWLSQSEYDDYKRYFELEEKEISDGLTDDESEEIDVLFNKGFYTIGGYCDDCEEDIEVDSLQEFNNLEFGIIYDVVKQPDLTYEKL